MQELPSCADSIPIHKCPRSFRHVETQSVPLWMWLVIRHLRFNKSQTELIFEALLLILASFPTHTLSAHNSDVHPGSMARDWQVIVLGSSLFPALAILSQSLCPADYILNYFSHVYHLPHWVCLPGSGCIVV